MRVSRRVFLAILLGFLTVASSQGGEKPLTRIGFGSCVHQDKPQPIWEPILALKPDLFLMIGDNIYADVPKDSLKIPLVEHYAKQAMQPGYQKLLKTCPVLGTWDDHDYGLNDAGTEYKLKKESQQAFLDFFGVPKDSPRRKQEGIYHSAAFGPPDQSVQIILLDTRYFRSPLKKRSGFSPTGPYEPSTDKTATMLGEAQWAWLEGELKKPVRLRILASSIQVVPQDHGWEKWFNIPHERERLFKLLHDTKAEGVLCISGDRHLAELSMMDAGLGYPLYDLTSSGLTQASLKWRTLEVNRHRVATMQYGNNFGFITVDWSEKDPLISLQVRDGAGDITIQQKVHLSVLKAGTLKTGAGKGSVGPRIDGQPVTAELVKTLLGKTVTLQMKVAATGAAKTGLIFLNSDADRGPENFTVVLDKKAQAQLTGAGIAMPQKHYLNKSIVVQGELSLFRDQRQIVVSDAKQIKIAED